MSQDHSDSSSASDLEPAPFDGGTPAATESIAPEDGDGRSEEQLIAAAQSAISSCNWVVGECAAEWTRRYARGRTDADFARLVGLSPDQVYQRRRVWETFADVRGEFGELKWSHFYVAINWEDATECLQWADENDATVQEMKAWRRALHGEDLEEDAAADDMAGDGSIPWVGNEVVAVRDLETGQITLAREGSEATRRPGVETVAISAGQPEETGDGAASGDDYAPFRQGAVTPPSKEAPEPISNRVGGGGDDRPEPSDDQVLKRMVVTLERIDQELNEDRMAALDELPGKVRDRLIDSVQSLSSKVARLL